MTKRGNVEEARIVKQGREHVWAQLLRHLPSAKMKVLREQSLGCEWDMMVVWNGLIASELGWREMMGGASVAESMASGKVLNLQYRPSFEEQCPVGGDECTQRAH